MGAGGSYRQMTKDEQVEMWRIKADHEEQQAQKWRVKYEDLRRATKNIRDLMNNTLEQG